MSPQPRGENQHLTILNQVGSKMEQHWRHPETVSGQTQPECDGGDAEPGLEPEEDV